MKTVGIIGFNGFGEFLAGKLDPFVKVCASSRNPGVVPTKWRASFDRAVACDYLILSIPLSAYESVLLEVAKQITSSTVIIDVCSVKVRPVELLDRHLPGQKRVITHPLFGPQSAMDSLEGHTMVLCPEVSDKDHYSVIKEFCQSLGLTIAEISADKHDQEMANVHALTFFIARALVQMNVHESLLRTPSFQRILDLADLERHHSEDLFRTIQLSNPYATNAREAFITAAQKLNQTLL